MYHFHTIRYIFPKLASINKRHDKGNESCGGKNNTDDVKTNESKVKPAANTKGTDKETENEPQERFPDITDKELVFQRNAMESLFFSLSDNTISETRDDRIILLQNIGRRKKT
jgi:hypothetical protein